MEGATQHGHHFRTIHGASPAVPLLPAQRKRRLRVYATYCLLQHLGVANPLTPHPPPPCFACLIPRPFPPLRQIPVKALNARSLFGSIFNLAVGLVLALSAAVLAFKSVPTTRLGAARPEAAWAFFWGRATALMVLSEGAVFVC